MDNRTRCWCGKWHRVAPKVEPGKKQHTSMLQAWRENKKEGLG